MIFVYASSPEGDRSKYRELAYAASDSGADAIVVFGNTLAKNRSRGLAVMDQVSTLRWLARLATKCPCPIYLGLCGDDLHDSIKEFDAIASGAQGKLLRLQASGSIGPTSYVSFFYSTPEQHLYQDWTMLLGKGSTLESYKNFFVSVGGKAEKLAIEEAELVLSRRGTLEDALTKVSRSDIAFIMPTPEEAGCVRDWIVANKPLVSLHDCVLEGDFPSVSSTEGIPAIMPGKDRYALVVVGQGGTTVSVFEYGKGK